MDFTRQPIIETIITPKEGCKLVVRSSKNIGQEEYFVDSLELVSFGNALFFRSTERPKSFFIPVSDYEVLEVREARMVLKNVGVARPIKIGGGRDSASKPVPSKEKEPIVEPVFVQPQVNQPQSFASVEAPQVKEVSLEKKRDKRRHYRRRRGREEVQDNSLLQEGVKSPEIDSELKTAKSEIKKEPGVLFSSLLPPPPTLISDTIARYKDNALFRGAFIEKEVISDTPIEESADHPHLAKAVEDVEGPHPDDVIEAMEMQNVLLEPSEYGYLGFGEEQDLGWMNSYSDINEGSKEVTDNEQLPDSY